MAPIQEFPPEQFFWVLRDNERVDTFVKTFSNGLTIYASYLNYCNLCIAHTADGGGTPEEKATRGFLEEHPMSATKLVDELTDYNIKCVSEGKWHMRGLLNIDAYKNDIVAIGKARDELYHTLFDEEDRVDNYWDRQMLGIDPDEAEPVTEQERRAEKNRRRQAKNRAARREGFSSAAAKERALTMSKTHPQSAPQQPGAVGPKNEKNRRKKAYKREKRAAELAMNSANARVPFKPASTQRPLPSFGKKQEDIMYHQARLFATTASTTDILASLTQRGDQSTQQQQHEGLGSMLPLGDMLSDNHPPILPASAQQQQQQQQFPELGPFVFRAKQQDFPATPETNISVRSGDGEEGEDKDKEMEDIE